MEKFTKEMVDDYADKLLIGLTEEENKMVLDEFEIIDQNINVINEIEGIENVEPMSHCLDDFEYELREDNWHWVTITGFDEEEEKLIWSNCGECEEIDWNMLFDTDKKYYVGIVKFKEEE